MPRNRDTRQSGGYSVNKFVCAQQADQRLQRAPPESGCCAQHRCPVRLGDDRNGDQKTDHVRLVEGLTGTSPPVPRDIVEVHHGGEVRQKRVSRTLVIEERKRTFVNRRTREGGRELGVSHGPPEVRSDADGDGVTLSGHHECALCRSGNAPEILGSDTNEIHQWPHGSGDVGELGGGQNLLAHFYSFLFVCLLRGTTRIKHGLLSKY